MAHKDRILHTLALFTRTLTIFVGLAILISVMSAAQNPLFLPPLVYDSGASGAQSVAVADVNGDGKLDLVVANPGFVGVLMGNGDGTFRKVATYTTGSAGPGTSIIAVGDLNNDGKPEVVVIGVGSETLSVLLGNGDGTFQPATVYLIPAGGYWPGAVAVADMNNDGNADLLLGDGAFVTSIGVALGNGSGAFSTYGGWSWYYPNGLGSSSIVAADINNDGKTDVVVTTWYVGYSDIQNGAVSIFLGNGDGTLQPAITYNLTRNAYAVAVGDLDGDGKLDLAVATSCSGCEGLVNVLLGNGDGTFQQAVSYDSGGLGAQSVAIADVDRDGKLDLVVANRDSNSVGVLLGNGNGTFQPSISFGSGGYPTQYVTTADLNGDGRPDLVVANSGGGQNGHGSVAVLLNYAIGLTMMTVTPGSLSVGTQVVNTTSTAKKITVKNTGAGVLAFTGIEISGTNAGDFSQTNNCSGSIVPGRSCNINVTFTPGALGTRSAVVTLTDDASDTPQTVPLSGKGVAPATLAPASLAFGNVAQGYSSVKTVTLTNNQTVALSGISISTGNADYTETDTCGTSIAAKTNCTITVTFVPSMTGADNATLTVTDSASNGPRTLPMTGSGLVQVMLTPASTTYSLQTVGTTSTAKTFTFTSNLPVTLNNIVIGFTGTNAGDFNVSGTTCGSTLAAKGKCTISVVFKPTAAGTRTATLSVSDSANNTPQTSALAGTGK